MSYLNQTLIFESNKIYYHDSNYGGDREVMMDWEDPLMSSSAAFICQNGGNILEIGFGMVFQQVTYSLTQFHLTL